MAETTKRLSEYDYSQVLQKVMNNEGGTLGVDGFLAGKVGHKITQTVATTSVANDTEIFRYYDSANLLLELTIIYSDGTRATLLSAERTA